MIGGRYAGKVTIQWSCGYVNGSMDCYVVRDQDTGKYWRITEGKDEALRVAHEMANGRPVEEVR